MHKSHKFKKIFIGIISLLIIVLIVGLIFVSSRLPNQLSIPQFLSGLWEIEIEGEDFTEITTTVFFYREGNVISVINHLDKNGIKLLDQIGSKYVFVYEGHPLKATTVAITRWHNVLMLSS